MSSHEINHGFFQSYLFVGDDYNFNSQQNFSLNHQNSSIFFFHRQLAQMSSPSSNLSLSKNNNVHLPSLDKIIRWKER